MVAKVHKITNVPLLKKICDIMGFFWAKLQEKCKLPISFMRKTFILSKLR